MVNELESVEVASSLDDDDLSILFYIAGYVGKIISSAMNCSSCISFFLDNSVCPEVEVVSHPYDNFFREINRGGLKVPSDNLYTHVCETYRRFLSIRNSEFIDKFMSCTNPSRILASLAKENQELLCSDGHRLNPYVSRADKTLFNIIGKNLCKTYLPSYKPLSSKKTRKLQSTA